LLPPPKQYFIPIGLRPGKKRLAIDSLTTARPFSLVLRFSLLLAAVALVKGVFQYWMRVILIGISLMVPLLANQKIIGSR